MGTFTNKKILTGAELNGNRYRRMLREPAYPLAGVPHPLPAHLSSTVPYDSEAGHLRFPGRRSKCPGREARVAQKVGWTEPRRQPSMSMVTILGEKTAT